MDRTDHRADWNGGIFSFGSYGRNAEADGYFRSDRACDCDLADQFLEWICIF